MPGFERAVVLGGSGFLGRALADALRAASRAVEAWGKQDLDLTAPHAETRLAERLDSSTALVVAAAVTPDRDRGAAADEANRRMIERVATALRRHGAAHCVYFSSSAVYGDPTADCLLDEEAPLAPTSPYAASKVAGEQCLQAACEAAACPLLIVRPSVVYGPADTHEQYGPSLLVRQYRSGEVHLFGDGDDARDFVLVDDVGRAVAALLAAGAVGVVNVGCGRAVSFARLVEILRGLDPRPVRVVRHPRRMPRASVALDIGCLLRLLDGRFAPTGIEEGLRRTWEGSRCPT